MKHHHNHHKYSNRTNCLLNNLAMRAEYRAIKHKADRYRHFRETLPHKCNLVKIVIK